MWGPKAAFPTRMNSGVEKMYKNSIAIAIGTLTMAVEFSMVSANAEPAPPPGQDPHMPNSAMGYCPGGGFGGITGWDIVTESDIQTAAIGIKCGYQRRLLVRRLPCRVLLTMVARCHH